MKNLWPFPSRSHRSPWWVMTGAALWCGPWLSIIPRESGDHTCADSGAPPSRVLDAGVNCVFSCVWSAVASLNTPMFPSDPSIPPAEKFKALPKFDYQIYFQKPVSLSAACEHANTVCFNKILLVYCFLLSKRSWFTVIWRIKEKRNGPIHVYTHI